MADKCAKGRARCGIGERQGLAKLKSSDVVYLRGAENIDLRDAELARYFNVSESAIYDARHGRTWKHLAHA